VQELQAIPISRTLSLADQKKEVKNHWVSCEFCILIASSLSRPGWLSSLSQKGVHKRQVWPKALRTQNHGPAC
jgi:hypothetical protein